MPALRPTQGAAVTPLPAKLYPLPFMERNTSNVVLARVCRRERARAVTVVFGSLDVGSAIGLTLCGPLITAAGWPSVFYLVSGPLLMLYPSARSFDTYVAGCEVSAAGWDLTAVPRLRQFAALGLLWCVLWPLLKPESPDASLAPLEQPHSSAATGAPLSLPAARTRGRVCTRVPLRLHRQRGVAARRSRGRPAHGCAMAEIFAIQRRVGRHHRTLLLQLRVPIA